VGSVTFGIPFMEMETCFTAVIAFTMDIVEIEVMVKILIKRFIKLVNFTFYNKNNKLLK